MKLTIAYDGTGFGGSQVQPGQRTIQEELEGAIARIFGRKERTTFAGRTDRGVHAAGQVAGVIDRRPNLTPDAIGRALNAILPDDVVIQGVERIEGAFHARFDARWREYRYRVWSGPRIPLARGYVWRVPMRLELAAMQSACGDLAGEQNFAAFASGGEGVPWSDRRLAPRGTVREVFSAGIHNVDPWWTTNRDSDELLEFRIVADAFLPRMVRNIVGALVEIGRGAHGSNWIGAILASQDRRQAGMTAPPHGLTLWQVGYGDTLPPTH